MFYVNRKTSRKSWMRPEEQKLDLDLNISTGHNMGYKENSSSSSPSSSSTMVALACSNCHLLVILCRSSPSCPNCKYVHSLASSSPKAKGPAPAPAPSSWGLWTLVAPRGNFGIYVNFIHLSFLVFLVFSSATNQSSAPTPVEYVCHQLIIDGINFQWFHFGCFSSLLIYLNYLLMIMVFGPGYRVGFFYSYPICI